MYGVLVSDRKREEAGDGGEFMGGGGQRIWSYDTVLGYRQCIQGAVLVLVQLQYYEAHGYRFHYLRRYRERERERGLCKCKGYNF